MHVLWLIPEYFSFLKEELQAVAPLVGRCSVLSQADAQEIPGVTAASIPSDSWSPARIARRGMYLARAAVSSPLPGSIDDLLSLRRLARFNECIEDFVRREKVDVIHSHFAVPEGTAGRLAALGRPVILTLRGVDILTVEEHAYGFMLDRRYRQAIAAAFRAVDCITVASRQAQDATLAAGAPAAALRLIPNGVNLDRFFRDPEAAARVRARLGLGNRPIIAAAGNLVATKSFDRLVAAFASVRRAPSFADWTLVIAGHGPEQRAIEHLAAELGQREAVHLPGRLSVDDMRGLLSAASLLVHPSLSEGFGNIVVEAMAIGCPVLPTATGAARDIIIDTVNGRLVQPGDAQHLEQVLGELMADEPTRLRYADMVAAEVRQRYTIQARATAFAQIYRQLSPDRVS